MSEIKEAIDRAASYVMETGVAGDEFGVKQALLAIVDALVEIAAVLPAPHAVPKETE